MRRLVGFVLAVAATACTLIGSTATRLAPATLPRSAPIGEPATWTIVADSSSGNVDFADVRADLAVAGIVTLWTRAEVMRCVTAYTTSQSDGTTVYHIHQLGPAEVSFADSTGVWTYHSTRGYGSELRDYVCADTMPMLHTHLIDNGWLTAPSDIDFNTLRKRSGIPFGLLLSVVPGDSAILHLYKR